MPHEFDAAITTYREAQQLCQTLSGDALSRRAGRAGGGSRRCWPERPAKVSATSARSSQVLQGLMHEGRWFDGRDFQLLDSIRRDAKAMVLKWQG